MFIDLTGCGQRLCLLYGAGGRQCVETQEKRAPTEEIMNKLIVAGIAVVALSVSPAWALKHPHHAHHHMMKPAATNTTATQTTWPFGGVSDADKKAYARNKRDSGIK